jgi:lipid-binding SYLF domain-containing protein
MIQKAVGLAFMTSHKVVLGVSLHAGSGIVLDRLSDDTWSAPSAIGICGLGLGIQVGVQVASYIFVLNTKEALEHFQRRAI